MKNKCVLTLKLYIFHEHINSRVALSFTLQLKLTKNVIFVVGMGEFVRVLVRICDVMCTPQGAWDFFPLNDTRREHSNIKRSNSPIRERLSTRIQISALRHFRHVSRDSRCLAPRLRVARRACAANGEPDQARTSLFSTSLLLRISKLKFILSASSRKTSVKYESMSNPVVFLYYSNKFCQCVSVPMITIQRCFIV